MATKKLARAGLVLMILVAVVQTIAAQQVTVPRPEGRKELQLPGILYKPSGDGPFPALVMLVGCEGIADPDPPDAKNQAQWVERLVGWGYAALLLDSFTPRGPSSICDNVAKGVSPATRSQDAYAAKSYLSTLPFVDPDRIGVIGWSHGGQAIMTVIDRASRDKKVSPFKAAVAFYPWCQPLIDPDTPLLVLIGRKDDVCPASLAEALDRNYRESNWKSEFSLTIYPDATHSFDVEGLRGGVDFKGHHKDYDPQATSDAIARTKGFLAKYLVSE